MGQLIGEGFVEDDGLQFEEVGDGTILLEGQVKCQGGICVDILKTLTIVSGEGADALVQTTAYSYNVFAAGVGNIFRYCSPHGHRPYHHKHVFDVLAGDVHGEDQRVDERTWPTLGEVLQEARVWFHEHGDQLEAKRR